MRKLAIFAAAFSVAAAVFVYGLLRGMTVLYVAGACLVLSPLALKLGFRRVCAAALGLSAGLIWCFGYRQIWLAPLLRIHDTEEIRTVQILEEPERTSYGMKAMASIELEGRTFEGVLYTDAMDAKPGDRITAKLYAGTDVNVRFYGKSDLEIQPGEPDFPTKVRLWLQNRIHHLYQGDVEGLVRALLTGDRSELPDVIRRDLSVAGMSHAVAVSGMHVSMLLAMVAFCCGKNPRLTAVVGIPLAILFTLMTGASPSACRAAVMQILLLAAPLVRREHDPPTALGAAALLLLLQNPRAVSDISFQLSFAAVAGLLLFASPIQKRLLHLSKRPGRILRFTASAVAASLAATALTMPLIVFYFHLVSIAAVLTNLLGLWAVTGIFTLGLLSCFLGKVPAFPAAILAKYVLWLCRRIASFPYAAAFPQNLPLMVWAVCAYAVAYWLLLGRKRPVLPWMCLLTASFLGCILWGRWNFQAPVCRVLDVGQGQCILIEQEGVTAVVDCGGSYPSLAAEVLTETLHSGGQTGVDALVVTHYDADHAGDAAQLLSRISVGAVFLPDIPDKSGTRAAIEAAAEDAGSAVIPVSTLTEASFSGGKLTVYPPLSLENDNNSGICVLATASEYDMLITGDLDQYLEMRLLGRWKLPQVEVLVAGHHGSKSATSAFLLKTVRPKTVVISVGEGNSYGNPAEETLARITESGADLLRTDEDGTVALYLEKR